MTDKEYEKQRQRVIKYWDKWYNVLGIHWWRINRNWHRERREDSPNTFGDCSTDWEYRNATINFYLLVAIDMSDNALEEAVVHEFVHVLAAPLHDFRDDQAREITEHTVTTIARQIVHTWEDGWRTGRNYARKEARGDNSTTRLSGKKRAGSTAPPAEA